MKKTRASAAADAGAVGAAEAGQVADVDELGDQDQVELALGDQRRRGDRRAPRHQPRRPRARRRAASQRVAVAVGALARDLREDEAVEDRDPAPVVARLDVGEVDLDRRQAGDVEGVGDRAAVVGPGAGVDDDGVGEVGQPVQVLDELALGVGLEEDRLEAELAGEAADPPLQLVEREAAVDRGVAALEDVEVDAVQDGDAVVGGSGSSRSRAPPRRRGPYPGRAPGPSRGSPGSERRTKPTPGGGALLVALQGVEDGVDVDRPVERDRQVVAARGSPRPRRAARARRRGAAPPAARARPPRRGGSGE